VPAVHTEALAWRGETWRWLSAAAGASGDRVLASTEWISAHDGIGQRSCMPKPTRIVVSCHPGMENVV